MVRRGSVPGSGRTDRRVTAMGRPVVELQGTGDQGEMAECLRCVAELSPRLGIPLLTEQPDVIAQFQEPFEQRDRFLPPSGAVEGVDEPEGAGKEHAFVPGKAILPGLGSVSKDEPVLGQVSLDGSDRPEHPGISRRQEAHPGDEQEAGVKVRAVIRLDETVQFGVETAGHDLGVDGGRQRLPAIGRAGQARVVDPLDHPIGGDPGHPLSG